MNASGDAAEQTFRMVIDGTEFVLKISGSLIKETLAMLYAISKDNKQNSIGKTNLTNMLKTCKDIKIFSIQRKDLDKFVKEAKNYGIYYCTLIDRKNPSEDSIVDIMVRANDAPRVDRIVERFNLSITDTASLRTESVKENGRPAYDAIIVDEAQFLSRNQIDALSDIVDNYNIPVLCYGLRTDFQSNAFEGSARLLELADELIETSTVCWCGRKARFNARVCDGHIVRDGAQVQMGGNESYVALCRRHFKQGKIKRD